MYLRNQAVEVLVGRAINVKGAPTDIIDGLVIKEHCNIGVLQERMG